MDGPDGRSLRQVYPKKQKKSTLWYALVIVIVVSTFVDVLLDTAAVVDQIVALLNRIVEHRPVFVQLLRERSNQGSDSCTYISCTCTSCISCTVLLLLILLVLVFSD